MVENAGDRLLAIAGNINQVSLWFYGFKFQLYGSGFKC